MYAMSIEFKSGTGKQTDRKNICISEMQFDDRRLLHRALTHRSYLNENPEAVEDNERLEFLGDAVLDFLVGSWLYNRFPEMDEGYLTRLRSSLVRTEQLANFAREIELGDAILLGRGETESGGRKRDSILCASFEALIGAIFLDRGMDHVRVFVEPFLEESIDLIIKTNADKDPKSRLQELAQARGYETPVYKTVNTEGPDHARVFEVVVELDGKQLGAGKGNNKQIAAQNAAAQALDHLPESVG
jgi:ribonuclease-3